MDGTRFSLSVPNTLKIHIFFLVLFFTFKLLNMFMVKVATDWVFLLHQSVLSVDARDL